MDTIRYNLNILLDIQRSLETLNEFMEKKDETAAKLSDVWNTIIDCRVSHLKHLFTKYEQLQDIRYILNQLSSSSPPLMGV